MVAGIVFKKGTCGCIPVNHLRACSTNINANDTSITEDDYEYFEPGGSNCVITGKLFNCGMTKARWRFEYLTPIKFVNQFDVVG